MRSRRISRALGLGAWLGLGVVACGDEEPGGRGAAGDEGVPGARGDAGEEGRPGPEGPPTDAVPQPSLMACFPAALYLGHPTTLTISGQDTSWEAPELDLGEIGVTSLTVASPTALVADVAVPLEATPGALDVVVTEGATRLALGEGVEVLPSLGITAVRGAAANGSSFLVDVQALDPSAPLDADRIAAEITGAEGLRAQVVEAGPWVARLRVDADVGASDGLFDVVVHEIVGDETIGHRAPEGLSVTRREPTALDLGAPPAGVAAPDGSDLYVLTPPDPTSKVTLTVTTSGGEGVGAPTLVVVPPSGVLADAIAIGASVSFVAVGDEPYYLVVIDETGASDYDYSLTATVVASPPPETEPNELCVAPGDAVTTFPSSFLATLASGDDVDWFSATLSPEDAGMRLRARTVAGEPTTDVEITVFAANCTTVLAGPRDIDFHENLLTEPLPAGEVRVRVRPSPTFPFQGSLYELTLSLEP